MNPKAFISLIIGLATISIMFLFLANSIDNLKAAQATHTHEPTGIQTGIQVCIEGQGAVDFDLSTARPFLVCGKIREEEDPPLGTDTHLAQ